MVLGVVGRGMQFKYVHKLSWLIIGPFEFLADFTGRAGISLSVFVPSMLSLPDNSSIY